MLGLVRRFEAVPNEFQSLIAYVAENVSEEITLEDLAAAAGLSRFALCRRFEKYFYISAIQWLWEVRIHLAKLFLDHEIGGRLTDVAVLCGFTSLAHFSRNFRSRFSMTPSGLMRLRIAASEEAVTPLDLSKIEEYVKDICHGLLWSMRHERTIQKPMRGET